MHCTEEGSVNPVWCRQKKLVAPTVVHSFSQNHLIDLPRRHPYKLAKKTCTWGRHGVVQVDFVLLKKRSWKLQLFNVHLIRLLAMCFRAHLTLFLDIVFSSAWHTAVSLSLQSFLCFSSAHWDAYGHGMAVSTACLGIRTSLSSLHVMSATTSPHMWNNRSIGPFWNQLHALGYPHCSF